MIVLESVMLMEHLLMKETFFVLRSRDFTTYDRSSSRLS
jgi:hypothetical protein